jgi:CheY-like chemotaxis protein/anti-sigma regulatory factor (Ser/Thr protein kinase)
MLNIINDIVSISKIESGQMEMSISETDIKDQIEFIYTFFKPEVERKGIQISIKNALLEKETINTDREKLYAILTNLIGNAIKFTKTGTIEFGCEKKGEYLEFVVKDTGVGIPDEKQELIFERFRQGSESHTRNYEGAGLGLSISKAFVEMLGGRIWVESEVGKGSTFYFTIPIHDEPGSQTVIEDTVTAENKEGQIKNLKILIAEDDETSEMFLSTIVQLFGSEVFKAGTGIEAVEICRSNPDLDLILMDIRMPRMDGYAATKQIRQFNKDVVIIAQTAYAIIGDREKALEAGCNDHISKPIDPTLLKALIRKHFVK